MERRIQIEARRARSRSKRTARVSEENRIRSRDRSLPVDPAKFVGKLVDHGLALYIATVPFQLPLLLPLFRGGILINLDGIRYFVP